MKTITTHGHWRREIEMSAQSPAQHTCTLCGFTIENLTARQVIERVSERAHESFEAYADAIGDAIAEQITGVYELMGKHDRATHGSRWLDEQTMNFRAILNEWLRGFGQALRHYTGRN